MKSTSRPVRSAGFTMLEVLISIVIVAFGLLGIAGLQAYALKSSVSASQRLTATALANDMIDRLKSNYLGVTGTGYNRPNTGDYDAPSACTAVGATCTSDEVAQNDRFEWQQRIAVALPNGRGIVCRDATPNDGTDAGNPSCDNAGDVMYVVKIWWNDDRATTVGGAPAAPLRFSTAFNP